MRKIPTRKLSNPCPVQYASEHFQGKHNMVGGYAIVSKGEIVRSIPPRCASCGAR